MNHGKIFSKPFPANITLKVHIETRELKHAVDLVVFYLKEEMKNTHVKPKMNACNVYRMAIFSSQTLMETQCT